METWWKRLTRSGLARCVEQRLGPDHVRAEEAARVDDGEAVVRLGGEVDDDLGALVLEEPAPEVGVGDVALDERDPLLDVLEVRAVARVGEEVERDHLVLRVPVEPVVDEVRADETGRAGHENPHERKLRRCRIGGNRPIGQGAALARLADLLPVALDLLRAIEVEKRLVAAPLFDERAAEVVGRVRLVQLAGALELRERLAGDRLGLRPAALAQERRRLVGQRLAARVGGRRRWWPWSARSSSPEPS